MIFVTLSYPGLEYFYLPRTMEQLAEFDSILESKFKTEVFHTYPVDNISEVGSNIYFIYLSPWLLGSIYVRMIFRI